MAMTPSSSQSSPIIKLCDGMFFKVNNEVKRADDGGMDGMDDDGSSKDRRISQANKPKATRCKSCNNYKVVSLL
jgi:hypothetical protein